jgi:hypothetical protein
MLADAASLTELVASAERILAEDLAAGHVAVLVEMITGASSSPGLAEAVEARLEPWRDLARDAVARAFEIVPLAAVLPADEAAHVVVATLLGLELLAGIGDGRTTTDALFGRARDVADLLEPRDGPRDGPDRAPRPRTARS